MCLFNRNTEIILHCLSSLTFLLFPLSYLPPSPPLLFPLLFPQLTNYEGTNSSDLLWPVVASFAFFSPSIGRQLPVQKFALLCAPSAAQVAVSSLSFLHSLLPSPLSPLPSSFSTLFPLYPIQFNYISMALLSSFFCPLLSTSSLLPPSSSFLFAPPSSPPSSPPSPLSQVDYNNVFNVSADLPLDDDEHWVAPDILSVMRRECGGWHHEGVREM